MLLDSFGCWILNRQYLVYLSILCLYYRLVVALTHHFIPAVEWEAAVTWVVGALDHTTEVSQNCCIVVISIYILWCVGKHENLRPACLLRDSAARKGSHSFIFRKRCKLVKMEHSGHM